MFIYFEDWSLLACDLDRKGIPNQGIVIKVFASPINPREFFGKERLAVLEIDSSPLNGELFEYPLRGIFKGEDIEQEMRNCGLNNLLALSCTRALFRLANLKSTGFVLEGMKIRVKGRWILDHPLADIDGIKQAARRPEERSAHIHLDVFRSGSLSRLRQIIDLDDPEQLVDRKLDGPQLRQVLQSRYFSEGNTRGKERGT